MLYMFVETVLRAPRIVFQEHDLPRRVGQGIGGDEYVAMSLQRPSHIDNGARAETANSATTNEYVAMSIRRFSRSENEADFSSLTATALERHQGETSNLDIYEYV